MFRWAPRNFLILAVSFNPGPERGTYQVKSLPGHDSEPLVSIVVPSRNSEVCIRDCLMSILRNDYPRERMQVLVVDGQSTDKTVEIVRGVMWDFHNVELYANPNRLPYSALNIGLSHARGSVFMRVDTRCIVPSDYVRSCVRTLEATNSDNVGGVQWQTGNNLFQKAVGVATRHPFGSGNAQFRIGQKSGPSDTVFLGCYRREVFDRLGKFDEDGPVISEDASMNMRIIRSGGKVYLDSRIKVFYTARESLSDLWRQYFTYGGAKAHIFLKYRRLTSWRQAIPLLLLTSLLGTVVFSMFQVVFLFVFVSILGIYLVADLGISALLSIRERNLALSPHLMTIFPCMHLGWAFGFVIRLLESSSPGKHWRGVGP